MVEPKQQRGFAVIGEERRREISSSGGRASHAQGTGHEFDPDEAREAGRKGGLATSRNREHMAEIGRRGGQNKARRRALATETQVAEAVDER
jgi:general stress protein YciG